MQRTRFAQERLVVALLLLPSLGGAQISGKVQITGTTFANVAAVMPVLTNVAQTSSASTIAVKFDSGVVATPGFACGLTLGTYNLPAVDNGIDVLSPIHHWQIVKSLSPSTTYFCRYTATNTDGTATGTFTLATRAVAASTPITSVSFSTPVSAASVGSCTGVADTFGNAVSNDGSEWFINDDTSGWQCAGEPPLGGSDMTVGRWNSVSPLQGQTVNFLTGFGPQGSGSAYDGASSKANSLFAMAGYLFVWGSGQFGGDRAAYPETGGNLMMTPDHAQTFNNFQEIDSFTTTGQPTTAAMFPSGGPMGTLGGCTFLMTGPDDGTLGYFQAVNQHDNADAFVYLYCNDGFWNNGNAYYLARVPRAKLVRANPADYEFYISGDGSQDSAWTSSAAAAQPILTNTGKLSWARAQYIPALNRIVLIAFNYPQGLSTATGNKSNTSWLIYDLAHPWSTPALVATINWPTQGYYDAVPIVSTAQSGTTPTVVLTGSFCCTPTYVPYTSTMTLN